jgi:C1A family cysteine protease
MRHSINIMFGQNFVQTIQDLKKYVIKYGEKELSAWFNAIHWEQNAKGDVTLSKVELRPIHPDEFVSGLNDLYNVELAKETVVTADNKHAIADYFDNLCANTVTSGNVGDYPELHFCLYIPLYDPDFWEQAKTLTDYIKSLNSRRTHIDIVGFASDLANVIYAEDQINLQQRKARELQTKTIIQEVVKYRNENPGNIYHFLVMQNTQTGGISLNLNNDSFVRVLGEFAMMCVENYQAVFGIVPPQSELQSFGLSVLHFDRYYFIEYLLHNAYLFAMKREGIHEEEVDINRAFNKSKEILTDRLHILSNFFKNDVLQRLHNKQDNNQIVEEVTPLINAKLNEINKDCELLINDKKVSIPAKRAILTALLGYDDELFVNHIFNDNPLIFDDLDSEAMTIFIDANNNLLYSMPDHAKLSQDGEPVVYPQNDMKKLRTEMQRRIGFVRDLESQQKKLEIQIGNISESKKCLIEGDFYVFGDHKFRLLPKIIETPLQDDYVPHKVSAASVDLREHFSTIKNQGEQGSCTAHALASIYEYILKSNKAEKTDLSEAFLYYNARLLADTVNKDEGSSYGFAIDSLVEYGICEEIFMPYNEYDYISKPTMEAYNNAGLRRVRKAVNVKRDLNDIKSALEDGYPVAISTVLYDSFGQGHKGVVSMPTWEELETVENEDNKHRNHAMVICGYSDEKKLFIVRNSWGLDFGDKGYCYLPYSYITNENLVLFAAAITEIETTEKYSVVKKTTKSTLKFDEADIAILYALNKNEINEEQILLKKNEKCYNELRKIYEKLKLDLKNPNKQSDLRNSTQERIKNEIHDLDNQRNSVKENKYKQLDNFDKYTRRTGIILSLTAIILIAGVFQLAYFVGWRVFAWEYTWYSFGVVAAIAASFFLFFPYRKRKRKEYERLFNEAFEEIAMSKANKEKELAETSLKMHIAGHFLTKLFDLHSTINSKKIAVTSLLSNLKTWYNEENDTLKLLDANTQIPFIPLLKNEVLDHYFAKNKKTITDEIILCAQIVEFSKHLENETISKENLKHFKDNIKELCIKKLEEFLHSFNVYSFLCNPTMKYEFLDENPTFIEKIIPKLDDKSQIFLCDNGSYSIVPGRFILIHTPTDDDARQWERFYQKYFSVRPNALSFLSPDKVMVIQLAELNISQIN